MKYLSKFIYTLAVVFIVTLAACEKVIEVDLGENEPKVVIEAIVFDGINPLEVKISRSANYFTNEPLPVVDNATVSISDGFATNVFNVPYVGDGLYRIDDFEGFSDTTYTLEVDLDGVTYSATSKMPKVPVLDSLYFEYEEESLFQPEGYVVYGAMQDAADEENFYRIIYSSNDTLQNDVEDYIVFDDGFINGNAFEFPIFVRQFELQDKVDLTLYSTDQAYYDYFFVLIDIVTSQGGGDSAAPENPPTNLSNGALGYFAAISRRMETITITE